MGSFYKAFLDEFTPKIYWNKFIRIFIRINLKAVRWNEQGLFCLLLSPACQNHREAPPSHVYGCWGSNPRFYECQVPTEPHAPDTILILSNRWWLNNSKHIQAIRSCAAIKEKWIQNHFPDTVLPGQTLVEYGDRSLHHSLETGERCMYGHYATPVSGNPDDHHKGGRDGQRHKQVPS